MKTKKELEKDILAITMKIRLEYPELSKYISEMPERFLVNDTPHMSTNSFKIYYNSLEELLNAYEKTHLTQLDSENQNLEGYPHYPPSEDLFQHDKEMGELNPEDLSKHKAPNEKPGMPNEKSFEDDMSGEDLDVPGSELDDQQEGIGSEDEENNHYSIGGDNHNDLDEDKG